MKQKNTMNANGIVRWMAALKMQAQYVSIILKLKKDFSHSHSLTLYFSHSANTYTSSVHTSNMADADADAVSDAIVAAVTARCFV